MQTLTNVSRMFTTVIHLRIVQTPLESLRAHAFKVMKEMAQTATVRNFILNSRGSRRDLVVQALYL